MFNATLGLDARVIDEHHLRYLSLSLSTVHVQDDEKIFWAFQQTRKRYFLFTVPSNVREILEMLRFLGDLGVFFGDFPKITYSALGQKNATIS